MLKHHVQLPLGRAIDARTITRCAPLRSSAMSMVLIPRARMTVLATFSWNASTSTSTRPPVVRRRVQIPRQKKDLYFVCYSMSIVYM